MHEFFHVEEVNCYVDFVNTNFRWNRIKRFNIALMWNGKQGNKRMPLTLKTWIVSYSYLSLPFEKFLKICRQQARIWRINKFLDFWQNRKFHLARRLYAAVTTSLGIGSENNRGVSYLSFAVNPMPNLSNAVWGLLNWQLKVRRNNFELIPVAMNSKETSYSRARFQLAPFYFIYYIIMFYRNIISFPCLWYHSQ